MTCLGKWVHPRLRWLPSAEDIPRTVWRGSTHEAVLKSGRCSHTLSCSPPLFALFVEPVHTKRMLYHREQCGPPLQLLVSFPLSLFLGEVLAVGQTTISSIATSLDVTADAPCCSRETCSSQSALPVLLQASMTYVEV